MGAFKKAVPTERGLALLTKVLAGTAQLEFTKIAVSDTVLSGDLSQKTNIGTLKQSAPASAIWLEGTSSIKVSAGLSNTDLTQGYHVRNIGLWARDPAIGEILYSISVADEEVSDVDWMPPYSGGGISSLAVDLFIELSDASNVSVNIDATAGATVAQILTLSHKLDTLSNDTQNLTRQFYESIKNHEIKTYTSLASIGLEVGKETIETIVKALPVGSILMIPVNADNNTGIYPESGEGTLWVRYRDSNRAHFEFISAVSNTVYRGNYRTSTAKWSGWKSFDGIYLTIYNSFALMNSELGTNISETTPIVDIIKALPNNTGLKADITAPDISIYPTHYGILSIYKVRDNRVELEYVANSLAGTPDYNKRWVGQYNAGEFSGWESFLPLSGGTLTGRLGVGGGYGALFADHIYSAMQATKDLTNFRYFRVMNPLYEDYTLEQAVQFAETVNGKETVYNIFGEHNMDSLGLSRYSAIKTYNGTGLSKGVSTVIMTFDFPVKMLLVGRRDFVPKGTGEAGKESTENVYSFEHSSPINIEAMATMADYNGKTITTKAQLNPDNTTPTPLMISADRKTITITSDNAHVGMNEVGTKYYYTAIG
jgi:hypothetical protein